MTNEGSGSVCPACGKGSADEVHARCPAEMTVERLEGELRAFGAALPVRVMTGRGDVSVVSVERGTSGPASSDCVLLRVEAATEAVGAPAEVTMERFDRARRVRRVKAELTKAVMTALRSSGLEPKEWPDALAEVAIEVDEELERQQREMIDCPMGWRAVDAKNFVHESGAEVSQRGIAPGCDWWCWWPAGTVGSPMCEDPKRSRGEAMQAALEAAREMHDLRSMPRPGACNAMIPSRREGQHVDLLVPAIDTGRGFLVYLGDGSPYLLNPHHPVQRPHGPLPPDWWEPLVVAARLCGGP